MATMRRRWILAGLLVGALCTGCNVMALPFFLIPGLEPTHDAQCKLASNDPHKDVKVVILVSSELETRPEFLRVDRELSRMLAAQLREGFKKNKERVSVVATSQVEKYKDEDAGWKSRSPQEIGERFHADYVIDLEINSLSLYKPGSANTLYLGKAAISLDVVDVRRASEGPIYHEVYTCEYPRVAEIPAGDSDPEQFRQRFLSVIAKQLSWRFTAHPVEDDYDCR